MVESKSPKKAGGEAKSRKAKRAVDSSQDGVAASPNRIADISTGTDDSEIILKNSRLDGDGESLPDSPSDSHDEETKTDKVCQKSQKENPVANDEGLWASDKSNPFQVQVSVDVLALALFVLGAATRMYKLDLPRNVVFDEMHYGKYASLYLKGTFFFDSNPPLGKMIVALGGYLSGYKGDFGFDKIGVPYPDHVPVAGLRFFPALFGSALLPTVYLIVCELGMTAWAGALAGFFMLLDTAFLAQSRYILLESMMMWFAFMAVLSVLKMRRYRENPFSAGWWIWLVSASVNMGLAFCVKYLAFYSCCLCFALFARDFWLHRLPNKKLSHFQLFLEYSIQSVSLVTVPILIYLAVFYAHFAMLTKAGTHDFMMTRSGHY